MTTQQITLPRSTVEQALAFVERVTHWTEGRPDRHDALTALRASLQAPYQLPDTELERMRQRKDAAYLERNQVVAALAKCFPSGIARTAIEGWSEDWHGCVYINLPTGQVSWHFHDSQAYLFNELPSYPGQWDGHDTDEKYRRVAALQAQPTPVAQPETTDVTFGATLFAFVRMSLAYPTEAQLHQLDRLIAFYGDQKFASQLKLLAHQARTPHVSRDVGRARSLVFSGSEGIGRKESEIQAAPHNHEDLKQLAEDALREHDGTDEGFHNWRAANRAFRRKTHPASILSLLSELNTRQAALQAQPTPPVGQPAAEPVPPFGSIRKTAMAVYKPPFKYLYGYIYDSENHMVADNGSINDAEPSVSNAIALRIRGWGRIGYMPDAEKLQDEVGAMVADALTAYYTTPQPTPDAEAMRLALEALKHFRSAGYGNSTNYNRQCEAFNLSTTAIARLEALGVK